MQKVMSLLFMCHRLPERSFFFRGKQFPLCARCTGIFIGYMVGLLYAFTFGSIELVFALLLLIPLIIDGMVQFRTNYVSTNIRRLITGILAGFGTDFIVYGVVTFYSFFTMIPKGEYPISICMGTACYVRGAEQVLSEFKRQLKVEVGESTGDGMFSLNCLRCVGACGLAPVVTVGEKVYGRVAPTQVKEIIAEYRNANREDTAKSA